MIVDARGVEGMPPPVGGDEERDILRPRFAARLTNEDPDDDRA